MQTWLKEHQQQEPRDFSLVVIPDPHAILRGDPIADHMLRWGERDDYNLTRVVRAFEPEPTSTRHGPVISPPAPIRPQVPEPGTCGTNTGGGNSSSLYSEVGDDLGGHDGDISSILEARGGNRVSTPRGSFSSAEVEGDGLPLSTASSQQGGGDGASPPPASGASSLGGLSPAPRQQGEGDSASPHPASRGSSLGGLSPASCQQGEGDNASSRPASRGSSLGGHESLAGKRSAPGSPTGTNTLNLLFYSCILNKSLVFSSRRWQGGVPAGLSSNTRPIAEHGCCTAVGAQALQECG